MSSYFRTYVALTEDQQGYSFIGKNPFGKVIIEARGTTGKLLVSAQGLKPQIHYKIYLVAKNTNKFSGVYMGDLIVNDKGMGDEKITFDAHNVGASGFSVDVFTVAAIIVHNAPALTVPLVGYINEPVFWKNGFEVFQNNEPEAQNIEVEVQNPQQDEIGANEEVIAESAEEVIEIVTDTEETIIKNEDEIVAADLDKNIENEVVENIAIENIVIEDHVIETADVKTYENINADDLNIHGKFREYAHSYNKQTEAMRVSEMNDDVLSMLFRRNAKMSPFIRKDPEIEWVRVAPEHAALIGLPEIGDSPFVYEAFRRYKHLVMGRAAGVRYILGIPDMFNPQTAPIAEGLGLTFKRCDGGEATDGSYGYWIIIP